MSTAVAHRRALYGHNRNAAWQAYLEGELPEGYRRVEYIESTGAQWIDTGISHTTLIDGDVVADIDLVSTSGASVSQIFIGYSYVSGAWFGIAGNSHKWGVGTTTAEIFDISYDSKVAAKLTFSVVQNTQRLTAKIVSDEKTGNYSYNAGVAGNFTLFKVSSYPGKGKVFSCVFKEQNVQVRHYIPALRLSDSKPGMYDLCGSICPLTGTPFYVNAGTGDDFLWKEFYGPHTDEVWYWAPEQVTLYSQTGVEEHTFRNGKGIVKFNAPVTTVGQILRATDVTKIVLPSGTTGINAAALHGCKDLVSILLPPNLKTIGGSAFLACSSLALTELPAGLTSIGQAAFQGCSALEVSELPSGITTLPRDVFYACYSIHNFVFNDGVDTIGTYIFYGVSNLNTVLFRGTPSSIHATAFAGCRNLHNIYVPWSEGEVANAPWGATNATIWYNHNT